MLFNRYKKSKVVYSLDRGYSYPTSIFSEPYLYNNNTYGCPAVQIANNRLYAINAPLDVKWIYNPVTGLMETEFTGSNTAGQLGQDIFNFINVTKQEVHGVLTLQCIVPYILFTDTKDIEVSLLPGTDLKMDNCTFIPGSFNIYSWNRMLNFAVEVTDKKKQASFEWSVDKPFMLLHFNRPVDVEYKLMTDEMWAMCREVKNITKLRNNTTKVYNTVIKRRPKKLL